MWSLTPLGSPLPLRVVRVLTPFQFYLEGFSGQGNNVTWKRVCVPLPLLISQWFFSEGLRVFTLSVMESFVS